MDAQPMERDVRARAAVACAGADQFPDVLCAGAHQVSGQGNS
eukprot:CAMPEP_0119360030 /NCGR_PEP_ID=MMETSP1334-20130426/7768_1 /TAXON_ID=127549 /ORGANISM="Calcidiscus leptoporus, Strain RCC1130" /LENGTH=41 /DNA_ID= /DNA_START= /DNA_END= /DNA_ORIENTATION=